MTVVEVMVSIVIFSIITLASVPLIGASMRGSARTRTETVGRALASETVEHLRGMQFYVAYSALGEKADVLDLYFPGLTPAYSPPTTTTGYSAGEFITTCTEGSTVPACASLPSASAAAGSPDYEIQVRVRFVDITNIAVTKTPVAGYAWNASGGADKPPSDLAEVTVNANWTVGGTARNFQLKTYVGNRVRQSLPTAPPSALPSGSPTSAPGAPGEVMLRAEARAIGFEAQTTFQDTSVPLRYSDVTAVMGPVDAYGEVTTSSSKAETHARGGEVRAVRPSANVSDAGVDVKMPVVTPNGSVDVVAPPDAGSDVVSNMVNNVQTLIHPEISYTWGMAHVAEHEAWNDADATQGGGPTTASGLPYAKGWIDFNSAVTVPSTGGSRVHMWMNSQLPGTATAGTAANPLNLRMNSSGFKMFQVVDYAGVPAGSGFATGQDPHMESFIDSTSLANPATRVVQARSSIQPGDFSMFIPGSVSSNSAGYVNVKNMTATVDCQAKADPSQPSTATATWSARLQYYADTNPNSQNTLSLRYATLPVQTESGYDVPVGQNSINYLKTMNGGAGPLIYDNSNSTLDRYMFDVPGKPGLLRDLTIGTPEISISADDRVASVRWDGIVRLESMPLSGSFPDNDLKVSIGKLSCKAEDYR
jgi:type II secretory pathway pseudopilin PulG